jgi:hypothetical protein
MTLKIGSLKEISNKYSSYFFDLDGVIVTILAFSGEAPSRSKEELRPCIS